MAKKTKASPKIHRTMHMEAKGTSTLPPGPAESENPAPYVSPLLRPTLPALSWYEIVATGFFSGYLPKAPGTWGSIFAVLFFFLTAKLVPHEGIIQVGFIPVSWYALALGLFTTLIGIISSGILAAEWREEDPQEIVIDEFAGVFLACALIHPSITSLIAAFVLFRIFDIVKPGPVSSIQELPGGRGIVLDDVLAGLFAAPLAFGVELLLTKILHA